MGITIGIDLGTTNSVTCIKKINASAIYNAEGDALTPSCVSAIPQAESGSYDFIVGRHSRELLKQYPEQTILSVKRLMGRSFEDPEVQNLIKERRVSYPITTDPTEPDSIRIMLGEKMHTPEMISGLILNKLITDGEKALEGKIDQAVVTVPAYFSDSQKFSTRAACDYAGIKLLRLLPEPTAAAISFGLELGENEARTIMVFDLGGGTFDISVLSFASGSFMEVTKGGDMWLGGDNVDQLLADHVFSKAEQAAKCSPITTLIEKLSPADRACFLAEIKEKAEAAKIALSTKAQATVEVFGLLKDENSQLIDIDVTITRAEFDELIAPIAKQATKIAEQILHEIRFEPSLIDTVLMVGGSSHIPAIQEALKQLFGPEKVIVHPRPMLAVAEGAALMAAKITSQEDTNEEEAFSIMHTTAHDYYLQLADGKRHLLVARNTPLPVTVEEKLTFSHHEQKLARLRVFNEAEGVLDTVGELWVHKADVKPGYLDNEKAAELMLQFSVGEDNIIKMKTWSLESDQQSLETQIARGGLTAKLYNDLESALSSIIANSSRRSVEEDALRLSRSIVSTVLSATDPVTGETRIEQKQKAQHQINTLKDCQRKDLAPLAMYEFALGAQKIAQDILPDDETLRLKNIVTAFKQAVDSLDDIEKLKKADQELEDFYEDLPIIPDLTRAEFAAKVLEGDNPGDAKQIRKKIKKLADYYARQDQVMLENEQNALNEFIYNRVSWASAPSGRFDRDVRL